MEKPDASRLNSTNFHQEVLDVIYQEFPAVGKLHEDKLLKEEKYKFLPLNVQISKLRKEFSEEVKAAEDLVRGLPTSSQGQN